MLEGRRLRSLFTFNLRDALPTSRQAKAAHKYSVTSSHYVLDSYVFRKREAGRVGLDGLVPYQTTRPFTVPYEPVVLRGQ